MVRGVLIAVASCVADHGLKSGLSSCDAQASLLLVIWNLPPSGIKALSLHCKMDS